MTPSPSVKQQKNEIRSLFREKRRSMSPGGERKERDTSLVNAVLSMVSFRFAEYVLMYAPQPEEIDVTEVARRALSLGKRVFFPKCDTLSCTMEYREIKDLGELSPGAYGISEPPACAALYEPDRMGKSALCLIPGIVYDRRGYRIGYGKGFYDRYLSGFSGCSAGVVYSDCIIPAVPRGRFDVKVDILITEKGVRMTSEN